MTAFVDDITIGIPVYNEGRFINDTLLSVDGQAGTIIVSDNASDDGTSDICADFARTRPYVRYHRYKENRGATVNFNTCLDLADSRFFMYVGAHDLLLNDHTVKLKRKLLSSPAAITAYTNAFHVTPEDTEHGHKYVYDYHPLLSSDSMFERVRAIAEHMTDGTFFHGLHRSEILKSVFKERRVRGLSGSDHLLMMLLARRGKLVLCEDSFYVRMDPHRKETSEVERWNRVLRAIDPENTNTLSAARTGPQIIYAGQLKILADLVPETPEDRRHLLQAKRAVVERWHWKNLGFDAPPPPK